MNQHSENKKTPKKFIFSAFLFGIIFLHMKAHGEETNIKSDLPNIKSSATIEKNITRTDASKSNPAIPDATKNNVFITAPQRNNEDQFSKHVNLNQTRILDKLDNVNNDIQFLKTKVSEDKIDWLTALASLLSVLLGAGIAGYFSGKYEKDRKKFEINKHLIDWKVQQLSGLYGPLHALLQQSRALYRHMNKVLVDSDVNRFRLHDNPTSGDPDNKVFQILDNNTWVDFRTVTHIDLVYGHDFKIEPYFDEIIKIGERMVKIVEEKAGYVREDQAELSKIFGQYLAHYAVLREVHREKKNTFENAAQNQATPSAMSVDESAAFPREIQKLVQEGYQRLNSELNNWGKQGK